jgi:hypothetical protein
MIKQCVVCGSDFICSPSDRKVTCGQPDCVRINKSRTHQGKSNQWSDESKCNLSAKGQTTNLSKGTPAAKLSPIAGSFETNHNAKYWVLVSPEGVEYKVRNLALWCKNNAYRFDRTPIQVDKGIRQIKRSMQGKTKRSVGSYLGWRLKQYGD